MPTYDYRCSDCAETFEVFHAITANPEVACPKCGETAHVKRLMGIGAAVVFKGSGFYTTDYRSDQYAQDAKRESAGGGGGANEKAGASESRAPNKSSESGSPDDSRPSPESGAPPGGPARESAPAAGSPGDVKRTGSVASRSPAGAPGSAGVGGGQRSPGEAGAPSSHAPSHHSKHPADARPRCLSNGPRETKLTDR